MEQFEDYVAAPEAGRILGYKYDQRLTFLLNALWRFGYLRRAGRGDRCHQYLYSKEDLLSIMETDKYAIL